MSHSGLGVMFECEAKLVLRVVGVSCYHMSLGQRVGRSGDCCGFYQPQSIND